MEIDKIYNEDCLVGMKDIPDKSIDAVICDLPYMVLNRSNPHAQWDNIIPFEPLWEQYERVLKEGFSISTKIDDVLCKPYIKELNIKLRYIDEEEPEAYIDEEGTAKED